MKKQPLSFAALSSSPYTGEPNENMDVRCDGRIKALLYERIGETCHSEEQSDEESQK